VGPGRVVMLIVRLRNLLLHWPDPVADARLYVDPAGVVYPPGANGRDDSVATNSAGEARLETSELAPGDHTLWIVPKNSSADPVGYWTATGPDAARVYRGMRIQFTVGSRKNVTAAV